MSIRFFLLFIATVVAIVGCSTSQPVATSETTQVASADIYINEDFRGTTPGTIRVNRRRKELAISLRDGKTMLRSFAVEEYYSKNADELVFNLDEANSDGSIVVNVGELPTRDKKHFIIPFYEENLTVKDTEYGLTIIVVN